MPLRSRWVWSAIFLLGFPILRAQVTFSLPVVNNAAPGTVVTMPVQVAKFDSIVGVQFVIQWDPAVINYLSVLNFNLPGLTIDNFGRKDTAQGILRFAWNTPLVKAGVSLPDSTAIFLIKFGVRGANGQGTPVVFTEVPPTQFEVVLADTARAPLRMKDCVLKHGYVAIGFAVSTKEAQEGPASLPVSIWPNPFANRTLVSFALSSADEVQLVLMEANGHIVEERRYMLPAGWHGIEIAASQLPKHGVYFLLLRTRTQTSVQPLVRL